MTRDSAGKSVPPVGGTLPQRDCPTTAQEQVGHRLEVSTNVQVSTSPDCPTPSAGHGGTPFAGTVPVGSHPGGWDTSGPGAFPCTLGVRGARVQRGTHADTCADPDTCPGCEPCAQQHCLTCQKAHAQITCTPCLNMARNDLRNVNTLSGKLGGEAMAGRSAHHVGEGVPGGDALVLLAPGATESGTAGQLRHRRTYGLDTTHTQDEQRGDPRPPYALLLKWEARWRIVHGHRDMNVTPDLGEVVQYLDVHLHEAARSPLFAMYAGDLAMCVRQLENVLHDGERPETSRVPCLGCSTRLVKVYGITEKRDHHVCPRCGDTYDRGRFDRAKHDHLASQGADRYVPVADAVATVGRPEQTVRSWVRRGLVDAIRDPRTRRLLVWWPHVREQHQQAQERKR